jgi:hypothetical protein
MRNFIRSSKAIFITASIIFSGINLSAQLTGTKNIPGDYPTLGLAITDLNAQGVGAGGVTLNLISGNPETAPAGGYVITATGTAANQISIVGNNNVITASGAQTAGSITDAVFKIIGGDYINIAQFVMMENPFNTVATPAASNNMTEFGVALFYASATDGAQNNSIVANSISLNRTYANTFGIYSNTRHTATNAGTAADITAFSGSNSNNKIYANFISNVNMGITFVGSNVSANQDQGNDIGGTSAVTGNTITNWGGAAQLSSYIANSGTSYCIFMNHQTADNISFNTITSAAVSGTSVTFRGILKDYTGTVPTGTFITNINNNTITMNDGFTSGTVEAIRSQGMGTLATATININGNTILNSAISGAASSSTFIGMVNSSSPGVLSMSNNIIRGFTSTATTGGFTGVSNTGSAVNTINLNNNQIGNASGNAATFSAATSGAFLAVSNTGGVATTTINMNSNSIQGFVLVSGGAFGGIINAGNAGVAINMNNNSLGTSSGGLVSYSAATSGTFTGIATTSGSGTTVTSISGNDFRGIVYSVASSANNTYISSTAAVSSNIITNNTFTNLNVNTSGTTLFIGHSYNIPATASCTISGNSIVTAFNRGGASGSVTLTTTNGSSPNGATALYQNNNFSNITVAGSSTLTGFNNTDGTASGTSNKTFTGNIFNNWTAATGAILGINISYFNGSTSSITSNTLSNFISQSSITGLSINASLNTATALIISSNNFNNFSTTGASSAVTGITCTNTSTGISFSGNTINTFSTTGAATVTGINIGGAASTTVTKNKIYDLSAANASGIVNGIAVSSGTTVVVSNNLIGDLRTPAANSTNTIIGINVTGGTTVNVYYNTIRLNASSSGANFGTSGISVSTGTTVDLRNNLVVNLSTASGTGLTVAYRRSSTTLTSYANTSNNNSFYAGTPSATNLIYSDGTANIQTLSAYQTAVTPRDAASLSENPAFISTTGSSPSFLHIAAATSTLLESGGSVIAGLTVDYDNDARPGPVGSVNGGAIAPDIGADEFDGILIICTGAVGGTISPSTFNICNGGTVILGSAGASSGPGITYQWKTSTVSGGPYSNVVGGSGATTASYTSAALTPGTYYYVLQVTCSNGPATGLSNEATVTVNPFPTISVSPSSAIICQPGGSAVALTASGASTYAWGPAAGLSATTGTSVNALPSVTTTYTITGTDVNGCVGTTTVPVTINTTPVIGSVTATPSSVCAGGNSQLLASAFVPSPVSAYTFSAGTGSSLDPMTGATTVIGAGDDDTPTGPAASIGFTFNFNGTNYTQFSVSPDGWILLGGTAATSEFTNAVTSTTNNPKIYPYWDDLATGTTGNVQTLVTGTAPNRIFKVQWFVTIPRATGNPANSTFQCWLYEASGVVEFRYGTMGVPTSGSISSGMTGNATNFQSISFASNTSSNSTANDVNTIAPATGRIYSFTPPSPAYSWAPPTFLNSTSIANPMANAITATTSYTVTASNAGCTSTGSVTITAGSILTSTNSVSPSGTVCAGTNVTFNVTPIGGGAPYTYAWTGPNSFTSTSQSPVITGVTVAASGIYSVTVTDACTSTSTTTVSLTVNPSPTVTVTPNTGTVCLPGGSVTLTASGATTYTWLPITALTPTTGAVVVANPNSAITYTVTGTAAGCTATATATISIGEVPSITSVTATPQSVCNNGSSQLLINAATTTAYTESATTFAPINSGTGTITLCNATVATTTLTAGNLDDGYWNGIAMPFNFNFFGSIYNTINVQTNGAVSFSPFTTSTGYNVTLPNASAPNNMIAGCFGDLQWGLGGGGTISCYTSGIAPNRIFIINFNGTSGGGFYNSTNPPTALVVMQMQLFESTNMIMIHSTTIGGATTVNHVQGIENASGSTALVVPGRNNTLWSATNDGIQFVPSGGTFTYSWTPATFLSSTTIANPIANLITATTTYTATATSAAGCSASGSTTITAGTVLSSTNSVSPIGPVCAGTNVTFNVTPTGGGAPYTYSWTGPNSFTSTSQSPVITGATAAASGIYSVTVTDACTSVSTTTVSITVNPLPAVAVTPGSALYCNPGTPIALTASGATTYAWGPAAGLSATTGSLVNASPLVNTSYTVTGTDANGCIATATTAITSAQAVTAPTASATPSAICAGSATNLSSSAAPFTSTILTENFNTGAPAWTRTNTSTGGTTANAAWTDRPDGFVYASGTPYHSNDNSQFVQSNSDAQGSGGTTQTTIQSPAFNTTGFTGLNLDFYQFYRDINDNGDSAVFL